MFYNVKYKGKMGDFDGKIWRVAHEKSKQVGGPYYTLYTDDERKEADINRKMLRLIEAKDNEEEYWKKIRKQKEDAEQRADDMTDMWEEYVDLFGFEPGSEKATMAAIKRSLAGDDIVFERPEVRAAREERAFLEERYKRLKEGGNPNVTKDEIELRLGHARYMDRAEKRKKEEEDYLRGMIQDETPVPTIRGGKSITKSPEERRKVRLNPFYYNKFSQSP